MRYALIPIGIFIYTIACGILSCWIADKIADKRADHGKYTTYWICIISAAVFGTIGRLLITIIIPW